MARSSDLPYLIVGVVLGSIVLLIVAFIPFCLWRAWSKQSKSSFLRFTRCALPCGLFLLLGVIGSNTQIVRLHILGHGERVGRGQSQMEPHKDKATVCPLSYLPCWEGPWEPEWGKRTLPLLSCRPPFHFSLRMVWVPE